MTIGDLSDQLQAAMILGVIEAQDPDDEPVTQEINQEPDQKPETERDTPRVVRKRTGAR